MSSEPYGRPPSFARVSLAVITSGREANLLGNIHGGEIVKLADSTAGAVAQRHSGGPAVTAALDEMAFLAPVHVGDIVHTFAQVNWAGRSSMEVGVRVEAQPWNDPSTALLHVASAYFVFVAIDADGRARDVPPLLPETPDEVRRMREAEIRRAHRLAKRQEIESGRAGT
ncbi:MULTISPECIES: acyl-CoA thioesterase [Nocardioides]|uniref:Acyl-CoA hydrolase n=1 Tax=Nocardioides lianchengensis TaxID=1045774 RepID=A0A1G6JDV1_9ACTN|nr:acyl-CoA thioesterase [Nocardioides lianchengensis]NYG12773.1 acyl-CoA hydrolase [Nocardioides lianchengensis]SDC16871.1 Acyl-CoA hydrolase [Nocardioides lianchengensis]